MKIDQDLMAFIQGTICLKKIKDGVHLINLDEYANVGTHWIDLFCNKKKLFISIFLVSTIFLKKLKKLLGIKT